MWFLIVWGKRKREKRLGFVADYCPICRKIDSFEVYEQRVAYHFWFIPTEQGRLLGNTQICRSCQTESKSFPTQFRDILPSKGKSLEDLIAETNPMVRHLHAEQLELADKIAEGEGSVDIDTRHRLMMEAFSLAEPHFQIGYGHQGRRMLALSLRPLKPDAEEIRACLQRYRQSGSRMGSRLRTADVMVAIYPECEEKDPNKFSY